MSKMIDGNALIMSLSDWWYSSFGQEETDESKAIMKVLDGVEKYVEGCPTYREWIPCSERLPKTDLRVLITAWGDTDIAWIDEYGLWQTEDYTFHDKEDVTAWMYLPDPYKGGEDE